MPLVHTLNSDMDWGLRDFKHFHDGSPRYDFHNNLLTARGAYLDAIQKMKTCLAGTDLAEPIPDTQAIISACVVLHTAAHNVEAAEKVKQEAAIEWQAVGPRVQARDSAYAVIPRAMSHMSLEERSSVQEGDTVLADGLWEFQGGHEGQLVVYFPDNRRTNGAERGPWGKYACVLSYPYKGNPSQCLIALKNPFDEGLHIERVFTSTLRTFPRVG